MNKRMYDLKVEREKVLKNVYVEFYNELFCNEFYKDAFYDSGLAGIGAVFCIKKNGKKQTVFDKQKMAFLDVSVAEVMNAAYKNMESDVLIKFMSDSIWDDVETLIRNGQIELANTIKKVYLSEIGRRDIVVITSLDKVFGASRLCCSIPTIQEKIGEEQFYIVPSSVHECLVYPKGLVSEKEMTDTLRETNARQVLFSERLSDNIYFYDGYKFVKISQ